MSSMSSMSSIKSRMAELLAEIERWQDDGLDDGPEFRELVNSYDAVVQEAWDAHNAARWRNRNHPLEIGG